MMCVFLGLKRLASVYVTQIYYSSEMAELMRFRNDFVFKMYGLLILLRLPRTGIN